MPWFSFEKRKKWKNDGNVTNYNSNITCGRLFQRGGVRITRKITFAFDNHLDRSVINPGLCSPRELGRYEDIIIYFFIQQAAYSEFTTLTQLQYIPYLLLHQPT
jgi:hypothetical protein